MFVWFWFFGWFGLALREDFIIIVLFEFSVPNSPLLVGKLLLKDAGSLPNLKEIFFFIYIFPAFKLALSTINFSLGATADILPHQL